MFVLCVIFLKGDHHFGNQILCKETTGGGPSVDDLIGCCGCEILLHSLVW